MTQTELTIILYSLLFIAFLVVLAWPTKCPACGKPLKTWSFGKSKTYCTNDNCKEK